ncbi:MAG: type II toxin-antitoxin system VapC family toxin [Polyangiaceae bacterium]|nr:type II toxin-antitoxin system VapC family toxin [Polyangiaceae bacterium]
MIYFLDASALVKRYVREEGYNAVRPLFRRRVAASAISAVEVPAALARRAREGDLPKAGVPALIEQVVADMSEMIVVEVRRSALDLARSLVSKHPLRAYDAVQLACALLLSARAATAITFVCADLRLSDAAAAEGARVLKIG